jgi:hypothetical protein
VRPIRKLSGCTPEMRTSIDRPDRRVTSDSSTTLWCLTVLGKSERPGPEQAVAGCFASSANGDGPWFAVQTMAIAVRGRSTIEIVRTAQSCCGPFLLSCFMSSGEAQPTNVGADGELGTPRSPLTTTGPPVLPPPQLQVGDRLPPEARLLIAQKRWTLTRTIAERNADAGC